MSASPSTLSVTAGSDHAELAALLAPYRPYSLGWLTQLRLGNTDTHRPARLSGAPEDPLAGPGAAPRLRLLAPRSEADHRGRPVPTPGHRDASDSWPTPA